MDVNANGVTQIKIWNGEEWKAQTLFTKTSQLENDSGFITASAIPSQISAFENDAGYITSEAIPSQISAFENDVGYVTAATLPSNLSDFNNDVGYITASALPSKTSDLVNDSGFITSAQVEPYNSILGYAKDAYGALILWGRKDSTLPNKNKFVTMDFNNGDKLV